MIKPTYLYIKEHDITGLKYLGKTIADPYSYLGSGKYWKDHKRMSNGQKGIIKTDQHLKKIGISISKSTKGKSKPTIECPICGVTGGNNVMKRWHFNNCKK